MKNKEKNVSIREWLDDIIADIHKFEQYWISHQHDENTVYPESLSKGDWDEQFDFFRMRNV